jgi:hypothetical protein
MDLLDIYGAEEGGFSTVRPVDRRDRLEAYPTLRRLDITAGTQAG